MTTIRPKSKVGHICVLGDSKDLPDNTLRACATCGKWWYCVTTYNYWIEHDWKPVRWYHFEKLERIRNYMEDKIPLP